MVGATALRTAAGNGRIAWLTMGAGALLAAVCLTVGPGEEAVFLVLGLGATIAAGVGIRRYRPATALPWILFAGAFAVFIVGAAARDALGTVGNLTASRSVVPDIITIPGYVAIGVASFVLARRQRLSRGAAVDAMLDAALAALAALTVAWIYLITPALFHAHAPTTVRLVLSAYPTLSVFVLAVTAQLAFSAGNRRLVALWLLLAAEATMLAGDVVFMFVEIGALHPGRLIDLPYAVAYLCFIATALHPSMRAITEPAPTRSGTPTGFRLTFVAVALSVPGLVTITRLHLNGSDRVVAGALIGTLTVAATWRMFRALRAHARSQAVLAYQATHDVLTGLPNRAYAYEYLARCLADHDPAEGLVAVLFCDADRFKIVNDSYGHSLGDDLLVAIAHRLQSATRPGDLVARVGGDEFLVVASGLPDAAAGLALGERIRASFGPALRVRDLDLVTSMSVGVAFSDAGADVESLVRDADIAMYQAKEAGRDSVAVFDAAMRDRAAHRMALEHDLRFALDREQLHLHYQPVVDLASGRVEGFEALVRWTHPTWGQIPPLSFIPIAEDTGLIVPIGAWVLDTACAQLAKWREELPGATSWYMAVNLSARQLRDAHLPEQVAATLAQHGLQRGAVHLELTESLLMENRDAEETLGRVRACGVRLAIDDFGTGYSSLAYLKRFAVDRVKIDRSFVEGLDEPHPEADGASEDGLITAIVGIAAALGITTTAEGVETTGQLERLRTLGCESIQGFLFSRPVAPDLVPDTVARIHDASRLRVVKSRRASA